jgi:hypothetical protein
MPGSDYVSPEEDDGKPNQYGDGDIPEAREFASISTPEYT